MHKSQIVFRSETGTLFVIVENGMYSIRDTTKPFNAQDFTYYINIADARNAFLEKMEKQNKHAN
jgi:hypothetical protein